MFHVPYMLIFLFIVFGIFNMIIATFVDQVASARNLRQLKQIAKTNHAMRLKLVLLIKTLCTDTLILQKGDRNNDRSLDMPEESWSSWWEDVACMMQRPTKKLSARQSMEIDIAEQNMQVMEKKNVQITRALFNVWLFDERLVPFL